MQKTFSYLEEFFVMLFLLALLILTKLALRCPEDRWPNRNALFKRPLQESQVIVTVKGEVEPCGRYHFRKGVSLREIMLELPLTENASMAGVNYDQKVKSSRSLTIKKKRKKGRDALKS